MGLWGVCPRGLYFCERCSLGRCDEYSISSMDRRVEEEDLMQEGVWKSQVYGPTGSFCRYLPCHTIFVVISCF